MTQDSIGNFSAPAATPSQGKPSNVIGLVGFIMALVSLVTCGLLAPISLIVSVIGLFKNPKGFAIAGAIISFLVIVVVTVSAWAIIAGLQQAGSSFQQGVVVGVAQEEIVTFYNANNRMPDQAELQAAVDATMTLFPAFLGGGGPVQFPYDYTYTVLTPNDYEYELTFPGSDGQLGTSDDLKETGRVP